MKTTFKEFIEKSIPNESQREGMRLWVKNALNGNKNDKILFLVSGGETGKTTLARIISTILNDYGEWLNCSAMSRRYFLDTIKGRKVAVFDGFNNSEDAGLVKAMLENEPILVPVFRGKSYIQSQWPNIIIASNEMNSEGINRRSIMVQMVKFDIIFEHDLFYELLNEKDSILNWFLK